MSQPKPLPTPYYFIIALTLLFIFINLYLALTLISNQTSQTNSAPETDAISIIDGDTFQTSDGETIRLLCVDTPELGTAGADESRAYLSSLIMGKDISIERQGQDKYNRTLAWITADNLLVNKELVDNGFGDLWVFEDTDCSRMK